MSYLKPKEIASILRVSPATVRRLIDTGELPGCRVGVQRRVDSVSLARFIRCKETQEQAVPKQEN